MLILKIFLKKVSPHRTQERLVRRWLQCLPWVIQVAVTQSVLMKAQLVDRMERCYPLALKSGGSHAPREANMLRAGRARKLTFPSSLWKEYCPNEVLVQALWDLIWTSDLQKYIVNLGFSPCSCQ